MKPVSQRSYVPVLWGIAIAGVLIDQATKYGVFWWLHSNHLHRTDQGDLGQYEIVPGAFELLAQFRTDLRPSVNQGALFGFLREHGGAANALFALVSLIAVLAIVHWSRRKSTVHEFSLCAALGLILAGTLGNLYDRIVFAGVRDFLHFYWIEWPVFNVADCCLVCGAGLLLAQAFWTRPAADVHQVPPPSMAPEVAHVE
jgi:signal peptidase II